MEPNGRRGLRVVALALQDGRGLWLVAATA